MNGPIRNLFVVAMLMVFVLVGATTWWTVIRADELNNDEPLLNNRALVRSLKIRRGLIRAAGGEVIARSVKTDRGVYRRQYPLGALFAHPIGYSFVGAQQTGFEAAHNAELMGERSGLNTIYNQVIGRPPDGDDITTTLDVAAQRIAVQRLTAVGGSGGAAVALDPRDGAVKVMASVPNYNPNDARRSSVMQRMNNDRTRRPLVNRAVQFGYAPGSTFKVVTATAALDSGRFTPTSVVNGDSGMSVSGIPLANNYGESFGRVELSTALTKSINTAWATVGEQVGKRRMQAYMRRFGFGKKPELDYPQDAMSASVIAPNPPGRTVPATSRYVDIGRLAIGQGGLDATPLQMAEVAATVANGGVSMRPHLMSRIRDSDGRIVRRARAERQARVMSPQTAGQVRNMMVAVVENGTGSAAQIAGVRVAGKTGTAETEVTSKTNNVWFIGFAPADAPRIAVAVTVQGVVGFGGEYAAPIARDIMRELLQR